MAKTLDPYGLEVSASGAAVDHWLAGAELAASFDHSGIDQLKKALEEDEYFTLARITMARQMGMYGQRAEAMKQLAQAKRLARGLTEREASVLDTTSASLEFSPDALKKSLAHIERWPTDVFVFSFLVGPFGQLAFSGSTKWRQDNVDLLRRYEKYWPENDWWFLTTLGFMLAETGDLSAAEKAGFRAFDAKQNGACAHTISHIQIEQGAFSEGQQFLKNWILEDGKKADGHKSDMVHHLHWHSALLGFAEGGTTTKALDVLYNKAFAPDVSDPMPLTTLSDNASLLWRCLLHNHALPESYASRMLEYADQHFPHVGFAFADIHKIILGALVGSRELSDKLAVGFKSMKSKDLSEMMLGLNRGFWAFSQGSYSDCANLLKPLLHQSVLLGGSNPQRSVVEETYFAACNRAGLEA